MLTVCLSPLLFLLGLWFSLLTRVVWSMVLFGALVRWCTSARLSLARWTRSLFRTSLFPFVLQCSGFSVRHPGFCVLVVGMCCRTVVTCSSSLCGLNGPGRQLLVFDLRLATWLLALLCVASSRTGADVCPCRLWASVKLLLFGTTMLSMTRLKLSFVSSSCVRVVLCVAAIRKLPCIRNWCSSAWTCLLLLIIRTRSLGVLATFRFWVGCVVIGIGVVRCGLLRTLVFVGILLLFVVLLCDRLCVLVCVVTLIVVPLVLCFRWLGKVGACVGCGG